MFIFYLETTFVQLQLKQQLSACQKELVVMNSLNKRLTIQLVSQEVCEYLKINIKNAYSQLKKHYYTKNEHLTVLNGRSS